MLAVKGGDTLLGSRANITDIQFTNKLFGKY